MPQIALHTKLKLGLGETYDRTHATIPPELDTALRQAGVTSWRIWRDGEDLFHLVDVDDFDRMNQVLATNPANAEWQVRINALLVTHGAAAEPLATVWQLPVDARRPERAEGIGTLPTNYCSVTAKSLA